MRKRIVLFSLIGVAVSALAFTGYKYASGSHKTKDPIVKNERKSDLFAVNELMSIVKKYEQAKTIDASFITNVIAIDGKQILEAFEGKYIRDSSNLYIKSYKSENILNKRFLIAIDNDEHVIYLEKQEINQAIPFFQNNFLSGMDSFVNMMDSLIFYEKLNEKTARLTIDIPSNNYYKTEFIYDIKTKEIKELRLYPFSELFEYATNDGKIGKEGLIDLNPNAKNEENIQVSCLSIIYTRVSINMPVNKKWFDEERIFTMKNNGFELKNQYKGYEIEYD